MSIKKIHELSDVQSEMVGDGTMIWQYSVVLPGAKIGKDCNICSHVFIENDVVIGDSVTIKNGVQIWDGIRVRDNVFIGPNVTFSNDKFPRSKNKPEKYLETILCSGASIGANATILPGVIIGKGAMVGAGAVVTKSVPPNAIAVGNPAVITGYVNLSVTEEQPASGFKKIEKNKIKELGVGDCALYELPLISDIRGSLSVAEYNKDIPFLVKRCFWVFDVPTSLVRGEHAHKELHQFLICVRGELTVMLDDGSKRCELLLNRPNLGLHIPPKTWGVQYKYSKDAVLMVLASDTYNSGDYMREYDEFLDHVKK